MATQDDITIVNGDEGMGFHCRACHTRFGAIPTGEVERKRAGGTPDEKVRLIVAEHIRDCPGLAAGQGAKKPGRPRKA
jgi:hypothetical protein